MKKQEIIKLQIIVFLIYSGYACIGSYPAVFYSERNLSYSQMGLAFAVGSLVGTIFQPLWGYISDRYLNKKFTLVITLGFSAFFAFQMIFAFNFLSIILLVMASYVFIPSISPLSDAYILDAVETNKTLNYSKFKFFGSFGFAISNLSVGFIVKELGTNYIYITFALVLFTAMMLALTMRDFRPKSEVKINLTDIKLIFADKNLNLFFISLFLMSFTVIGSVSFMNELMKYMGGDVTNLGTMWFFTCVIEMGVYFVINRLIRKLGVLNVFYISTIVFALKCFLFIVYRNPYYLMTVQLLEGIGFTLYIVSSVEYVNSRVLPSLRSTAMSIYGLCGGLGVFVSGLIGGFLLNFLNAAQLFLVFGGICIMALGISLTIKKTI